LEEIYSSKKLKINLINLRKSLEVGSNKFLKTIINQLREKRKRNITK